MAHPPGDFRIVRVIVMAVDDAFPTLSPAELATMESFGERTTMDVGDVLYHSRDSSYSFFAIVSGSVAIINDTDGIDEVDTEHGPGRFLGELNLLTGQRVYLTARVSAAGEVITVPVPELRRLIATVPDLSDTILTAVRRSTCDPDGSFGERDPADRLAVLVRDPCATNPSPEITSVKNPDNSLDYVTATANHHGLNET